MSLAAVDTEVVPPQAPSLDRKAAARAAILTAPVLPTMLRLAWPMIAVLVIQTLVTVAETFYVGFLGRDALAGVALVFPVSMLMTMMSHGGIGGGAASAVARAIGAGRSDDADALLLHTLVLGVIFGVLFTAAALWFGPMLYRGLGGEGAALQAALIYSAFVFAGAVPIWIVNLISAALRGVGNVVVPSLVILVGAAVLIPLSPLLIFGLGPVPGLGVAGAGLAVALYYAAATIVLLAYLRSGRGGLTLRRHRLERRLFADILGVGMVSAVGTVQTNLSVVVVTGAVGLFGVDALAGYGVAARLDYLLIPLLFGLGTAVVTMVGVNIGAGAHARAMRVAWTSAILAGVVTEAIGIAAALWPHLWIGLFSADAGVHATGAIYLRWVAPFYGIVGFGMQLYFAAQGADRPVLPFLAGTARLVIAAGVGWLVAAHGGGLAGLFAAVAASSVVYGLMMLVAGRRIRRTLGVTAAARRPG
jgi:putative MATE family efflux protein